MPARPIFQSVEHGENYKTRTGAGFIEQLSIVCRKIGINSEGREKLFRRAVRTFSPIGLQVLISWCQLGESARKFGSVGFQLRQAMSAQKRSHQFASAGQEKVCLCGVCFVEEFGAVAVFLVAAIEKERNGVGCVRLACDGRGVVGQD